MKSNKINKLIFYNNLKIHTLIIVKTKKKKN